MTISLRIDIDVPFGYYNKLTRMYNRLLLNYHIMPRWTSIGYLKPARLLRNYLHDNDVAATWFFGTFSSPSRKETKKFLMKRGSINIHAERTNTYESFQQEILSLEKRTGQRITGFSKHGSGNQKLSKYHDADYDEAKLLGFAVRRGLKYFIGNGHDISESWARTDATVFVPSVFWLDRMKEYHENTSISDLVKRAESEDIVALIHPVWWSLSSELRNSLEELIKSSIIEPLGSQIGRVA